MTRSKRARRLARREYAERHPEVQSRIVQQPTSTVAVKKAVKKKPKKPINWRREIILTLITMAFVVGTTSFYFWTSGRNQASGDSSNTSNAGKQYNAPPAMAIDKNKSYYATIETEKGNIRLELFAKDSPITVNNFVFLAREGFYDGLTFHRVLPGFVVQGGDPKGDGTGGPGYTIQDEFNQRKHLEGTIAMAHSPAPNSAGSQFYITLSPQPGLDGSYAVFGQVIDGTDTLRKVTLRNPDEKPTFSGDKINKITIQEQ